MNVKEFAEKLDLKVLVLVENAALDENARAKAEMHEVNILLSKENSYHLAVKLHELLS